MAVDMAFDPIAFKQTKHILRAASFLLDLVGSVVAHEVVSLRHVPGRVMIADLLTKAVARPLFHFSSCACLTRMLSTACYALRKA